MQGNHRRYRQGDCQPFGAKRATTTGVLLGEAQGRFVKRCTIDAEVAVEILNCTGLPKVLDPVGKSPVARNSAEPGQGCRVPVDNRHQTAIAG